MNLEDVKDPEQRLQKAIKAYESNLDKLETAGFMERLYDNYDMHSGRHYTEETKRKLNAQGIPSSVINFTKKEVNRKTGTLLENPVSAIFSSRGTDNVDETNILQDLYDYNVNRGSWEDVIAQTVRDAMILVGWAKMTWDFSTDRDFGDTGLVNVNPRFIKYDADWVGNNTKEMKRIWEEKWLTAKEISQMYNFDDEQMKNIQMSDEDADDYEGLKEATDNYSRYENKVSGKYKVIEMHYMQLEKISLVVNRNNDTKYNVTSLTEDDAKRMFQGHKKDSFATDDELISVNKTIVFAPALLKSGPIYDGDYELQLGRLPYFGMSYDIVNGEMQGFVDQVKDLNRTIDRRESSITNIISKKSNGNYFAEEGAFPNKTAENAFKQKAAMGGQVFNVSAGANQEQRVKLVESQQIPNDLIRATDRTIEQFHNISNSTLAVNGQGGGSHESGVLFSKKLKQSTSDAMLNRQYKNLNYDIVEAFYYAAPQIYKHSADRKFFLPDGRTLEINKFSVDSEGEVIVANDVLNLPRYDFKIDMSKLGATKREEQLFQLSEFKKITTNPLLQTKIEIEIAQYTELSEESRLEIEKLGRINLEFQIAQMESQTAQLRFGQAQAEQQLKQLQNPPQAPGGFQGPGPRGEQQAPPDARQIAKGPGMGELPNNAGVAGRMGASNNVGNAPSDMSG